MILWFWFIAAEKSNLIGPGVISSWKEEAMREAAEKSRFEAVS
jgi:hypothetical protein